MDHPAVPDSFTLIDDLSEWRVTLTTGDVLFLGAHAFTEVDHPDEVVFSVLREAKPAIDVPVVRFPADLVVDAVSGWDPADGWDLDYDDDDEDEEEDEEEDEGGGQVVEGRLIPITLVRPPETWTVELTTGHVVTVAAHSRSETAYPGEVAFLLSVAETPVRESVVARFPSRLVVRTEGGPAPAGDVPARA